MSISKLSMNLIIGSLVDAGALDTTARVDRYLPWIGDGYAAATVEEVLDMNLINGYVEG